MLFYPQNFLSIPSDIRHPFKSAMFVGREGMLTILAQSQFNKLNNNNKM